MEGIEESAMEEITMPATNLDGFESVEQVMQNSQVRLQALKGLYRTQLGFDGVQNNPIPDPLSQ